MDDETREWFSSLQQTMWDHEAVTVSLFNRVFDWLEEIMPENFDREKAWIRVEQAYDAKCE